MLFRRLFSGLYLCFNSRSCSRSYSTGSLLGCYDVAIIGGGIVGTAAAREITQCSSELTCAIIEKETKLGMHQSSHNSGVIHAGIYYKPGSVRATLCTEGMNLAYKYFDENDIPYKKVGKLIVATDKSQIPRLNDLYVRGQMNSVPDLKLIDPEKIKEIEPNCAGVKALHSPHTGIVDWGFVTECFGKDFKKRGGDIHLNFEVCKIYNLTESKDFPTDINKYPISIESTNGKTINAGVVMNCAGLNADQVASLAGGNRDPAIIPIRGEYLVLNEDKCDLVNGNIYPVPDPKLPFLGVHFTPRLDGSVWLGPNAVVAFKREGYSYSDIAVNDVKAVLGHSGFHKLAIRHMRYGVAEFMKSMFINLQVKELQKFVPQISVNDVLRGPTGVRAQALSPSGDLIEDFVFESVSDKILHCRNAPSPAATSSMSIAKTLSQKILSMV